MQPVPAVVPERHGCDGLRLLVVGKIMWLYVLALAMSWNDSMWLFCSGMGIQMNLRRTPRSDAAFLNFLPAYRDPWSHRTVRPEQSDFAVETASIRDSTATSVVASVLKR